MQAGRPFLTVTERPEPFQRALEPSELLSAVRLRAASDGHVPSSAWHRLSPFEVRPGADPLYLKSGATSSANRRKFSGTSSALHAHVIITVRAPASTYSLGRFVQSAGVPQ